VPEGTYLVRFSHPGFHPETRQLKAGDSIDLLLIAGFEETITVSAIRAGEEIPVTASEITREEIEQTYYGQDVPLLLRDEPAVTAYSESGAGSGYSYFSLRGVHLSRINFTLDGVPLADSEDMTTYFADFPDLARSLESIQVQRGVGTSTVGTASFGGSVNMESVALSRRRQLEATVAGGSFGNRQASAGYQSGNLPGDLKLYARLSVLESEGFREHAGIRQHNIFFSGSKIAGSGLLKLSGFSGLEEQQLSYYAADEETLRTNLRANPMREEETDRFRYDLAQLQYLQPLAVGSMTASVYYQRGYGWYRLFDFGTDILRQYGLDGKLIGSILSYEHQSGRLAGNYGLHANRFERDHTSDNVTEGGRDYANYGVKGEINAFAKLRYNSGAWLLYGDGQVRRARFDYHGSVAIPGVSWTFFNPKIGARYSASPASSVYVSAGVTSREPARLDMFGGADNLVAPIDPEAVKPERVLDIEAGWDYRATNIELSANLYAMEYRDEIAATGELSMMGLPLRRNVDRSHRRGIELEADWQASGSVHLKTSASFSRNRIEEWTQFFGTEFRVFHDVAPLLTPEVVISQSVDYAPSSRWRASIVGRYAGRSYLDNTNVLEVPSYFAADGSVTVMLTPAARLTLRGNNLLDNDRIYASGYSYLFLDDGGRISGTPYYFPQATRNFVLLLDFRL
jgi:iron complex outermembrane receptor protein